MEQESGVNSDGLDGNPEFLNRQAGDARRVDEVDLSGSMSANRLQD